MTLQGREEKESVEMKGTNKKNLQREDGNETRKEGRRCQRQSYFHLEVMVLLSSFLVIAGQLVDLLLHLDHTIGSKRFIPFLIIVSLSLAFKLSLPLPLQLLLVLPRVEAASRRQRRRQRKVQQRKRKTFPSQTGRSKLLRAEEMMRLLLPSSIGRDGCCTRERGRSMLLIELRSCIAARMDGGILLMVRRKRWCHSKRGRCASMGRRW